MSEVNVEQLQADNKNLNDQLKQMQDQLKGLNANYQAATEMHNEQLNMNQRLRANMILIQQNNQDLAQQVKTLTQKILEISPPKMDPAPQPQE